MPALKDQLSTKLTTAAQMRPSNQIQVDDRLNSSGKMGHKMMQQHLNQIVHEYTESRVGYSHL